MVLAAVWLALCAGLAIAMRQPPETFGRIMMHVPGPAFIVFPFETLWSWARAGRLHTGDPAPDFHLPTLDKTAYLQLASAQAGKPLVLVFGSYT